MLANSLTPNLALDDVKAKFSAKKEFAKARRVERGFAANVKKIAAHVADIVRGFDPTEPDQAARMRSILRDYATIINPWAKAVSQRMIAEAAARDKTAWFKVADRMGVALERELAVAPLSGVMEELSTYQARLISSLPIEAAEKVAEWTQKALFTGERPKEIAKRIHAEVGGIAKHRAMTIARTESSRSAAEVQKFRAQWVGIEEYTWTDAGDADVRPDHRILNGKRFRYDSPPIADRRTGIRANPGCIWRCRCIALPVIA